ncbi:MAG: hypothetical protein KA004_07265 [Verrucomicrobiales bacterium]|nr:hypothetical protein [Verrucomicrobiales bacterium]
MKFCILPLLLAAPAALILTVSPARPAVLWTCGKDDNDWPAGNGGGANASFVQENGVINPLPGSPNNPETNGQSDNDYYFAGSYTSIIATNGSYTPMGNVALNEESAERAFAGGDLALRYHFNVPAAYGPNARITVTFDPLNLDTNGSDPRFGVEVYINGLKVRNEEIIRAPQLNTKFTSTPMKLSEVGIVGGASADNIVTLKGVSYNGAGGGNWMGVDYVQVDIDSSPLIVNTFTTSDALLRPGESATLTWTLAEPAATVSINQGIGDVTAMTSGGTGSIVVTPSATTVYTLSATHAGQTQTKTVTVATSSWNEIFEMGVDNASHAEFSHESAADDDYYFAGDYTSVGGPVQAADEVLNDDANTDTAAGRTGNPAIGFERAVTEFDPHTNIWFIPNPAQVDPAARHRITVDVLGVGSAGGGTQSHNLEILLNDKLLRTENSIAGPRLIQFEVTGITSGLAAGPNKLTVRRTGGTLAGYVTFDYIMMEHLPGTLPTINGVTSDPILGTRTVAWTSAVAKTYRVQKSTDAGATWQDLAAGFPTGGAPSTSLFFEDRVTPHTDPAPTYRILQE